MSNNTIGFACAFALPLALVAVEPIAHWSFDDAANLGKDSIGNNHLTACIATASYGTPKSVVDGRFRDACDLKRSGTVGNAFRGVSGALPTGTNPFTVTAWIRPNNVSQNTAYLILHTPVTGGVPDSWTNNSWDGWYVRFATTGKLAVGFKGWYSCQDGSVGNVLQMDVPSGCHNDGKWHHVAIKRDASGKVRLFWDGAKSAEKTISGSIGSASAIRLGSYSTGNYFSGDYDEVKAWNVALSDDEIIADYHCKQRDYADYAVDISTNLVESAWYLGDISGSGTLTFSGVSSIDLLGLHSFAGTYRLYSADVNFGSFSAPLQPNASSVFDIAGGGSLNLFADATVAGISGEGLLGGVNVAAGKTLTVSGNADAVLNGQINGDGTFVKSGTGTLTVNGESTIGEVEVASGVLAVGRAVPFHSKNMTAYWRFEDSANIGRDLCGNAPMTAMNTDGATVAQTVGKIGMTASLRKGTTVACALVTAGGKVACGSGAFTVAAWIRPNSDSASSAYVLVNRTITGGKPTEWTGASWDGWHVRFWSSSKLAIGYTSNWQTPSSSSSLFVTGDLPNSTCYKDGNWHHVAVTRDEDNKTTLYFDGAKIAEGTITSNQSVPWSAHFAIGGQDSGNSFSGDYDEVQAYNAALTADEVASIYAATKPKSETRIVDEATAHWTFDEIDTDGDKKLFRDTGAANLGADMLNTANSSGQYVECVTGEGINGGAAYVVNPGSYLQLEDGSKAGGNLVQYSWPTFTVSIRIKNVFCYGLDRNPVFCFGNAHSAETCLRLSYEGLSSGGSDTWPQRVRVLPGNSYTNGNNGVVLEDSISSPSENSPWTTYTFVNDMNTKKMKVYRDGSLVQTIPTDGNQNAGSAFNFDLSRVDLGYNTYKTYSGFMVDDLCIFRKRVLSDNEVKRLALEQSGAMDSPFSKSDVAVANNAEIVIDNCDARIKSVSGAGDVTVGAGASLAADDWSGFTGSVGGSGDVVIVGWGPRCRLSKAIIAETGTLRFAAKPSFGSYTIATADTFVLPADFSGWVVEGVKPERYKFKVVGDTFSVNITGGMTISIR